MKEIFYHPLDLQEAKSRFELLLHGDNNMEIWDGSNVRVTKLDNFSLTNQIIQLRFHKSEFQQIGQELIVAFKVTAFNYIFRAKPISSDTLELLSPIYRSDRRKDERILLHPIYKAFAHINLKQSNIIYLIKGNKITEDQFELPVLDISKNAISFKATQAQQELFSGKDTIEEVKITIDGKGFTLKSLAKIYSVPVIDRRYPGTAMYKIGYTYANTDQALIEFIEARKSESTSAEYYEDFSQFLAK